VKPSPFPTNTFHNLIDFHCLLFFMLRLRLLQIVAVLLEVVALQSWLTND